MGSILFEVILIFILLLLNGVFSMSELAVVSARKIRLQQTAENGGRGAQTALELAENPSNFLSTVQIGITLIGILAGAFGGASIAGVLSEQFDKISFIAPYSRGVAFTIVVAVITYFSIIIGELIPKSLALSAPEKIAMIVSRPMKILSFVSSPVVWLLTTPTALFLKIFKLHASVEPPVTDEEIKGLIDAGTKAGVFEETEQDLIESVIQLGDQRVTSLMTPRTNIVWLNAEDDVEIIEKTLTGNRFSRLPVANGSLDNILGYASAKSLLAQIIETGKIELATVLQQPLYVPETLSILDALEQFRESHTHFAIVVDEHGGVEGLVTMNDVLESIVGEMASSQHNLSEQGIIRQADGALILDGRLSVFDFKNALNIKELPFEQRDGYQTVAGFVLTRLGKLPEVGDCFSWDKYEFEIISMERNRVDKIRLKPLPENENPTE